MKKLPLVCLCGVGIILLSAFGNDPVPPPQIVTPAAQSTPTATPTTTTSSTTNSEGVQPGIATTDHNTPAVLHNGEAAPTEATATQPEESKVWCERHVERCKHIHERKAKREAHRIEKLREHCEKHPHHKNCEELKEIANSPDKQDEVTKSSVSTQNQLEKHLEEHR